MNNSKTKMNPLRVIDFFCGAGGFSEGFRQAGFEILFAVDKWAPAVTTYKGNKPDVNVVLDDVIRISNLPDDEFDAIVPDSEVIIGSPPCQAFSQSNKSGNADKTLGIKLIESYLKIVARKKFKKNSILKYWVLENVPNSQNYIKELYTASDLGLDGNFELYTRCRNAGVYNAKYFGAPTNRKRFLCGDFPYLEYTNTDEDVIKLRNVLNSFGDPLGKKDRLINDINYPDFQMIKDDITDLCYIHELAEYEWKTARRLKQDKGYMGKMSFPENLDKPARTVMATMTASSREAMVLLYKKDRYRLPTVREVASMMSFPMDYQFYGETKGIKHTLVGNAVPPKLSYAIAKSIALDLGFNVPKRYIPIKHDKSIPFKDLNGITIQIKKEKPKRDIAKFKYHIPYLIVDSYRVELTNYHSDFENKKFKWDVEIHFSQGKKRAKMYSPTVDYDWFTKKELRKANNFIKQYCLSHNYSQQAFQKNYCLTQEQRKKENLDGPYELLEAVKTEILANNIDDDVITIQVANNTMIKIPKIILFGYYILSSIINTMKKEK